VELDCHACLLQGSHLASASGDSSVKLWSFEQQRCVATYTDHTQAVWGVAFHDLGDFVASCSLDHSARLWDITTSKCRQSLRCSFHTAMCLVIDNNRWRFGQMLDRTSHKRSCLISCRREAMHVYCKGILAAQVYHSLLLTEMTGVGALSSHKDT